MAKFKVGDRVDFNGVKGTVLYAREGKGMPTAYKVKGDDGDTYTPPEYALKYVGNSRRVRNSIDPAKLEAVLKRVLNKPGDKVRMHTLEGGLPNGMMRVEVEVTAAYHDDDKETPDYRIKAAKKAAADAYVAVCVGDGTRPMNDGSFNGFLRFMNSRACNASFKVGDVVYLHGLEKLKVVNPNDHGWVKCESIEGSHKGIVAPYAPSDLTVDARKKYVRVVDSRACNSRNPVVRKAMAINSTDGEMARFLCKVLHRTPTDADLNYYSTKLRRIGLTRGLLAEMIGKAPTDTDTAYYTSMFNRGTSTNAAPRIVGSPSPLVKDWIRQWNDTDDYDEKDEIEERMKHEGWTFDAKSWLFKKNDDPRWNSRSGVSTNAVVRKAMNAVARRAVANSVKFYRVEFEYEENGAVKKGEIEMGDDSPSEAIRSTKNYMEDVWRNRGRECRFIKGRIKSVSDESVLNRG